MSSAIFVELRVRDNHLATEDEAALTVIVFRRVVGVSTMLGLLLKDGSEIKRLNLKVLPEWPGFVSINKDKVVMVVAVVVLKGMAKVV